MVPGSIMARGRDVCRRNRLLILSVLSVTVGCLLGFFLRTQRLSPQVSHPGHPELPIYQECVGLKDLGITFLLHGPLMM